MNNQFAWILEDRFTGFQTSLIEAAAYDLATFINQFQPVEGWDGIPVYLKNIHFHCGGMPVFFATFITGLPTSIVFPSSDIWLADKFDSFPSTKRHILHEMGHVLDNRLPSPGRIPHTILGGGVADELVRFLGGKPAGLRFANGAAGIPAEFHWHGPGSYGNHSSADYFAEAFSWLPYDPAMLPAPLIRDWMVKKLFLNSYPPSG